METIRFDPEMTFGEVRRLVEEINNPDHSDMVVKLTWLEGNAQDLTVPFLYEPMAERFGHTVDKSSLDEEIVSSLYNGIPVEIHFIPRPSRGKKP